MTSTNASGTTFTVQNLDTAFRVAGGTGQDTLAAEGFTFTAAQRDQIFATQSIETITDTTGSYTTPPSDPNKFRLTAGDDTIAGTSGDDTFSATASTLNPGDSLDGDAGNDTLALFNGGTFRVDQLAGFTGFETITLNASSGSAILYLGNQAVTVTDNGSTSDTVNLGNGATTVHLGSGGGLVSSLSSATWNSANVIDGSANQNKSALSLNSSEVANANYDLTATTLTNLAQVAGSGDNLTLKINSADVASVKQFYNSGFSNDVLTTSDATLDLSHTSVSGFTVTSTNTSGTTFTVQDLGTALQVFGATGEDTLVAQGFTFTATDRNQIFATHSIETITDSSGTYTAAPTVVVTGGTSVLHASQTDTITFTFSEAVTGFDSKDVTVTGGTLGAISKTDATHYKATFTPDVTDTLSASVGVAASGTGTSSWTDLDGNAGLASTAFSITGDTKVPTVSVSGGASTLLAGQTDTITFTFSEAVAGFDASDVTVTGGALGAVTQTTDAAHYTATFTPNVSDTLAASVAVAASGTGASSWTDLVGNAGPASTAFTITGDSKAPTVSVSGSASTLLTGQTDTITFTFGEAVTGFDSNDVTVTGGALGAISKTDATHYKATFTPDVTDTLSASIAVVASGAGTSFWTDTAGNAGPGSNTFSITGDTKGPPVTENLKTDSGFSSSDHITNVVALTGTANKGEVVHLTVDANPPTDVIANSSTGIWTFTPTGLSEGAHTVGAATDADKDGNIGTASLNFTFDKTAPTVSVLGAASVLTAGQTDLITFTFSESVSGFDNADVKVTGGALGTIGKTDDTHYTATFTPTATDKLSASVAVSAKGWTDIAGNAGTASTAFSMTGDTKAPLVTETLKTDTGSSLTDKITNTVTLAGSGDKSAVVHFNVDGSDIGTTVTASTAGAWTFTPTGLSEGVHTIGERDRCDRQYRHGLAHVYARQDGADGFGVGRRVGPQGRGH